MKFKTEQDSIPASLQFEGPWAKLLLQSGVPVEYYDDAPDGNGHKVYLEMSGPYGPKMNFAHHGGAEVAIYNALAWLEQLELDPKVTCVTVRSISAKFSRDGMTFAAPENLKWLHA
jgi:hypothetical protein